MTSPESAKCACGHMVVCHLLSPKKVRKDCTHMGPEGQCPCKIAELQEAS